MNPFDFTVNQLRRAAAIKEQIEDLNRELRNIFGAPATSGAAPKKKNRAVSAATKRKIAAAQKARWANLRRGKAGSSSAKTAGKAGKRRMSRAARAKASARMKAYWAAKKSAKK